MWTAHDFSAFSAPVHIGGLPLARPYPYVLLLKPSGTQPVLKGYMYSVRERRTEVAMLRALGLSASRILALFLGKALLTGLAGGILGSLAKL